MSCYRLRQRCRTGFFKLLTEGLKNNKINCENYDFYRKYSFSLPSINPEMRFELSMKNYLHLRLPQIDPDCHSISHTKFKKRKKYWIKYWFFFKCHRHIFHFFVKDIYIKTLPVHALFACTKQCSTWYPISLTLQPNEISGFQPRHGQNQKWQKLDFQNLNEIK